MTGTVTCLCFPPLSARPGVRRGCIHFPQLLRLFPLLSPYYTSCVRRLYNLARIGDGINCVYSFPGQLGELNSYKFDWRVE